MIEIIVKVEPDKAEQVVQLIKDSGLAASVEVEDLDDQNLKPMTATDFYKRINAANLAQKEKRTLSQKALEEEVKLW
jgi:hypothetical protein